MPLHDWVFYTLYICYVMQCVPLRGWVFYTLYICYVMQCVPLRGWGFRRGGYQCVCKPGYRYPVYQDGHFQGIDMETATEEQYNNNFDCFPVTGNNGLSRFVMILIVKKCVSINL